MIRIGVFVLEHTNNEVLCRAIDNRGFLSFNNGHSYFWVPIYKEVSVAKRHCKGAYVRVKLPDEQRSLPSNIYDLLKEAVGFARLRAHSIWRMSRQVSEESFLEDQEQFREVAGKNIGLFHLLLAVFFTKMHKEMEHRSPAHKMRIRNRYLVAAMGQRELAHACLSLPDDDVQTIPSWDAEAFGIDQETWRTNFVGACSVARVICALMQKDADIFFPIAFIDIQWRIDLLVRFKSNRIGLCIQIKNWHLMNHIRYRLVPELANEHFEDLSESDQFFLNGVSSFRNDNTGTWLPLELAIGDHAYRQASIQPPETILSAFEQMLLDLFAKSKQKPTDTSSKTLSL